MSDLYDNSFHISMKLARTISLLSQAQTELQDLVHYGKKENPEFAPVEEFEHLLGALRVLKRSTFYSEVEWVRIMEARRNV
jgi:hypothetical protein